MDWTDGWPVGWISLGVSPTSWSKTMTINPETGEEEWWETEFAGGEVISRTRVEPDPHLADAAEMARDAAHG